MGQALQWAMFAVRGGSTLEGIYGTSPQKKKKESTTNPPPRPVVQFDPTRGHLGWGDRSFDVPSSSVSFASFEGLMNVRPTPSGLRGRLGLLAPRFGEEGEGEGTREGGWRGDDGAGVCGGRGGEGKGALGGGVGTRKQWFKIMSEK